MPPSTIVALVSLLAVAVIMLAESRVSVANERRLRERGAVEPPGDVYRMMQWVYPAVFVIMALEGLLWGPSPGVTTLAGAIVLVLAKALKFWAIGTLGGRWTFRILVPPDAPLVTTGPYVWLRHPNYVAVVGELAGMALLVGAPISGPLAVLVFGSLLRRRIQIENAALGYSAQARGAVSR